MKAIPKLLDAHEAEHHRPHFRHSDPHRSFTRTLASIICFRASIRTAVICSYKGTLSVDSGRTENERHRNRTRELDGVAAFTDLPDGAHWVKFSLHYIDESPDALGLAVPW